MKILHVLASDKFSGAENVACQIIGMFKEDEGIEMAYCSPDGAIRKAVTERGISFYGLKKLNTKELERVVQDYKPDLIHAHDMRASFVVSLVCKKIPFIAHIHNNAFDSRRISLKSFAFLFAAKRAKHIFWVSKSALEGYRFKEQVQEKSSVLYNVIDVHELYNRMKQDTNEYHYEIVYVGRLTYPKNPERLIDVLEKVIAERPQTAVAIIGSGELQEKIQMLIKEKKLDNNIEMLGFVENPLKIMHDAKVLVMTSRWEGTPMVALEAMALGLPIVGTPTDGLKDVVVNGKTGWLSDDEIELAKKIRVILTNYTAQENRKQKIIKKIMKNDIIEKYKSKITNVYRKNANNH